MFSLSYKYHSSMFRTKGIGSDFVFVFEDFDKFVGTYAMYLAVY